VKGRFYFADGRVAEDVTLDDRVTRVPMPDGDQIRWFIRSADRDPDGFTILREAVPPPAGDRGD
jgi:hypothetical protein